MFLPGRLVESSFEVCCVECGRTVDIIRQREIQPLLGYFLRTQQKVECFDCEERRAIEVKSKYDFDDVLLPADRVPACLVDHISTEVQDD